MTTCSRCIGKGYIEVERSEAFVEHMPCCPILAKRIAKLEAALKSWQLYDSESVGGGHPAPDYALAGSYREAARKLTVAALAKLEGP